MRLQLSLEFVLYTALAAASAASAISMFVYAKGSIAEREGGVYLEELSALINANMAYSNSTFYAFVPRGLCGAPAGGSNGSGAYSGADSVDGNLTIQPSLCGSGGGIARLRLVRLFNGTYLLEGASR